MEFKVGNILENLNTNSTYIIENIDNGMFTIASSIDTMNKKIISYNDMENFKVISDIAILDGRYRKFPKKSIDKESIQEKEVELKVKKVMSPTELMDGESWHGKDKIGEILSYVKNQQWNKLNKLFPSLKNDTVKYSYHHHLNPLHIFSKLYNELGKEAALVLASKYENDIWKMHKDSVFTDDIYSVQRNNGQPFDLEPKKGPYPNGLTPVMKDSSEDEEVDNPDEAGHGTLAPSDMNSINSTPTMRNRTIQRRSPTVNKVEWLDRISVKMITSRENETFTFLAYRFDVGKAEQIIANIPRETQELPVQPWANFGGFPAEENNPNAIGLIRVDKEYAMNADMSKPGILAVVETEAETIAFLIDGWHRLYRHWKEGKETIPVYVLTPEETYSILIGYKPRRPRKKKTSKKVFCAIDLEDLETLEAGYLIVSPSEHLSFSKINASTNKAYALIELSIPNEFLEKKSVTINPDWIISEELIENIRGK